ncbi:short chain alcohol dehydrogenase [Diplodia corticola]|uniref:Short chain alcohol dehydrogenase n=1 Tax=Diplodia corticola TaxID=236234 RepID=A0A1J9R323_9PEZI|nr:short chain alcohol dehydrogenase [Diplodia corticola]OJD34977.1 short chain alcohol dehydrogenase [Diplodia corticola]
MSDSCNSRRIVISGGARGIGRALARHFLEQGDRVFLIDVDEPELHHTVHSHLAKYYPKTLSSALCNLRDVDDIREKITGAAEYLGGSIDILINNGGIASPQWKDNKTMLDPSTLTEWRAYVETNLTGPFAVSQAALPYMRCDAAADPRDPRHIANAGPCIILVGSSRAHQSDRNQEGYAATKAGQLGLMHSMAVSCQPWGVRVNMVAPGRIKATHESREGDERGARWVDALEVRDVEQHPANRAGMPEDVAQAVEYLVGAGFVTAQEMVVDGGALMKK